MIDALRRSRSKAREESGPSACRFFIAAKVFSSLRFLGVSVSRDENETTYHTANSPNKTSNHGDWSAHHCRAQGGILLRAAQDRAHLGQGEVQPQQVVHRPRLDQRPVHPA